MILQKGNIINYLFIYYLFLNQDKAYPYNMTIKPERVDQLVFLHKIAFNFTNVS